eukprot:GFUD01040505.1.p1 GENE.GFUD01040505.1~~GFUD01040505.1.p1  ORF type:complete len:134 (+),score=17.01 GFUD01040505.1:304-705(+)
MARESFRTSERSLAKRERRRDEKSPGGRQDDQLTAERDQNDYGGSQFKRDQSNGLRRNESYRDDRQSDRHRQQGGSPDDYYHHQGTSSGNKRNQDTCYSVRPKTEMKTPSVKRKAEEGQNKCSIKPKKLVFYR